MELPWLTRTPWRTTISMYGNIYKDGNETFIPWPPWTNKELAATTMTKTYNYKSKNRSGDNNQETKKAEQTQHIVIPTLYLNLAANTN